MERNVAAMFEALLGKPCKRNPLSGANNRGDQGQARPGDMIVPPGYDFLVECKLRASFLHHELYTAALADAKKHSIKDVILCTKKKGQRGFLVIVDNELWSRIMSVPGAVAVLKRGE